MKQMLLRRAQRDLNHEIHKIHEMPKRLKVFDQLAYEDAMRG